MSEIWRTITEDQIKFVDDLAMQHVTARISEGSRTTNGQPPDFERRFRDTRDGYRAEVPVRLWLGSSVPWTIKKKITGQPDFAGFIDVKGRQKQHHRLTITEDCPSEYAYLLVCGARHPDYHIVGWCWGHEAKQPKYWDDPGTGRPAWWVPADDEIMKPPEALLIEVRRRLSPDTRTDAERAGHPNGFVGYDSENRFVHYCKCGRDAGHGYGVRLAKDEFGMWYCDVCDPNKGVSNETAREKVEDRTA